MVRVGDWTGGFSLLQNWPPPLVHLRCCFFLPIVRTDTFEITLPYHRKSIHLKTLFRMDRDTAKRHPTRIVPKLRCSNICLEFSGATYAVGLACKITYSCWNTRKRTSNKGCQKSRPGIVLFQNSSRLRDEALCKFSQFRDEPNLKNASKKKVR